MLYAIIGALYLVCAGLIWLIPAERFSQQRKITEPQPLGMVSKMWNEMRQGWSLVRRSPQLFLAVVQLSFAGVLLLVIGELATPIVTQLLLLSPNAMAFVFAPAGIGLVTGSILMPRIIRRLGKARAVLIGSGTLALATLLLPLVTILARSLQPHGWNTNLLLLSSVALLMLIAGFGLDLINIPANTAMQERTPEWIKGRVLALQLMLYNLCSIPVILFIGAIADLSGLDRVLYLMTIGITTFGLWSVYFERKHPLQLKTRDVAQEEQDVAELDEITP
jgi:MFS family permease